MVAVVAAGVKSILDIENTLEYLETLSVPVIGYQTDEFPAFYTRQSGIAGGVLIANPIPQEMSMDSAVINQAIESALTECRQKSIKGKNITPFLLDKIKTITKGESLKSNIALVKNNARVGAQLAQAYTNL